MRPFDIALSIAVHSALVAAAFVAGRTVVVSEKPLPEEPMFFELVTEEREAAAEERPQEVERVPEVPVEKPVERIEPTAENERPVIAEPPVAEPVEAPPAEPKPVEPTEPAVEKPAAAETTPADVSEAAADEERAKVVSEPRALNRITPRYPRSARLRKREGAVTVEFEVLPDGRVGAASVVASSGCRELDESALESARRAVFAPATEDGLAVSATLRLTFEFRLK